MAKKLNLAFSSAQSASFDTLGIGISTPNLEVEAFSTTSANFLATQVSGNSSGPGFLGIKGRGTAASPDFPQAADVLCTVGGGGYNGTTLYTFNKAVILFRAYNTWVAGGTPDNSTDISFQTTPAASTTRAEVFKMSQAVSTCSTPFRFSVSTLSNPTFIGALTTFTTYGCVALNNTTTLAGILGIYGGDSSDGNLYANAPSGWNIKLSVNNVNAATINATSSLIAGTMACAGAAISSSSGFVFPVGTTSLSSLRIPHGAAPSSPVNGDMWTTTAGLYVRINGTTVGPLT